MEEKLVIKIPKDVEFILSSIEKEGYSALIVGGCVRDQLINQIHKTNYNIHDYDIATNCDYDKLAEIFSDFKFKEVGKAFGVALVTINNVDYEIALFRKDGDYSDGRRPDNIKFTRSFEEDSERRDLTINSIGYSLNEGLIDYHNGIKHIKNKVVRCVGNPNVRFKEDYMRMLRCIRFATKYGFMIEKQTFKAIESNGYKIQYMAVERVQQELVKILLTDYPSNAFRYMNKLNILKYIFPELCESVGFVQNNPHHDKDVFEHTLSVIDNTSIDIISRLSALMHDISKPRCYKENINGVGHFYNHHKVSADMARIILKRLKFDNKTIDVVCKIVYDHIKSQKISDKSIKRFINRVGEENLENMFDLMEADIFGHSKPHNFEAFNTLVKKTYDTLNKKEPTQKSHLAISGTDIISEFNLKTGKIIGKLLDKCFDYVLEFPEGNTKEKLLEFVDLELKFYKIQILCQYLNKNRRRNGDAKRT